MNPAEPAEATFMPVLMTLKKRRRIKRLCCVCHLNKSLRSAGDQILSLAPDCCGDRTALSPVDWSIFVYTRTHHVDLIADGRMMTP